MSALVLKKDPESGNIVAAAIDEKELEGFVSVTQSLNRNCLTATLVLNVDSVDVIEDAAEEDPEPVKAPALTATFEAGTESGSTQAAIVDEQGVGNHFAYKVAAEELPVPYVDDVISDATTYTSGDDIPGVDVATNKYVGIYELTADNKAVKFLSHVVEADEVQA